MNRPVLIGNLGEYLRSWLVDAPAWLLGSDDRD
jgi:hypothetical protein